MEDRSWRLVCLIILIMCGYVLRVLSRYRFIKQSQYYAEGNRLNRQKIQTVKENTAFAETLYNANAPAEKVIGHLNNESFYDNAIKQEKTHKREASDALMLHALAEGLYKIFISNENSGHFFSLFMFIPEYLDCFSKEFYFFRYFLAVYFSEFYMGENHLSRQVREKVDDLILKSEDTKNISLQIFDGSEFLSLASERETQYRNNIPPNFDNSNREAVSILIKKFFNLSTLKMESIDKTLLNEDFYANVNDSLTKEYFYVREKIREHVQKTLSLLARGI